ncbi:FAD-dependent oxidoreductase [Rubinisphaera italica]|uniref:FAD dependent oxidoreductase n=1 Tax=Rubinisphaera italica TaxID=2527969 RepID=A0A5C5XMW5_9PLAN|nr:FAD-dependent oxidoreductase [Rubinisphaera italica]TWT63435.1 FAD dependent oxidoreductase [Rubinisphaera italica]
MEADVVIIGGGIAGLWTLDELLRHGVRALLLENRALGFGQTISSQGIIHGGLKYSLKGVLTASADEIREMPLVWRECLSGQREPNLSKTDVRSHCCYLWQTRALSSQAGMLGAQLNLRIKPKNIPDHHRPEILRDTPGHVYQLDEQVLSPRSLLNSFRSRLSPYLLQVDETDGVQLQVEKTGAISAITIRHDNREETITCRAVMMSAGVSNALLSEQSGRKQSMQLRPLHMAMVKGPLPMFQGHCIDGAKTRMTITSEYLEDGETVWQLGGNIAEQGIGQTSEDLIRFAARELNQILPALDLSNLEFATYLIDRAERKVKLGMRPDTPQILKHKNILTCWPTKLAFAPRVAERIQKLIQKEFGIEKHSEEWDIAPLSEWKTPDVAAPPWSRAEVWYDAQGQSLSASGTQTPFKQAS